jgi:Secretion system C-terminal sorting domain
MRYFLVPVIGLIFPFIGLSQEVVSASGNSYSNASLQVDFTIGEVVLESFYNSSYIVTQGFHQPILNTVLGINTEAYEIELYPNPVKQQLQVVFNNPTHDIKYHLVDIQGNIFSKGVLHEKETTLNLMDYQPGVYFLVLSNTEYQLKTYKIIKVN